MRRPWAKTCASGALLLVGALTVTLSACGPTDGGDDGGNDTEIRRFTTGDGPIKLVLDEPGDRLFVLNSLSETVSVFTLSDPTQLDADRIPASSGANDMQLSDQGLVITNSLANSVIVADPDSGTVLHEVSTGAGTNPYDVVLGNGREAMVSLLMTNQLAAFDLADTSGEAGGPALTMLDLPAGSELAPFDPDSPGEARPQGMALSNDKLYVALTNLAGWFAAGPGHVAVFDAEQQTSLGTIELATANSGYLAAGPASSHRLYASAAGDYSGNGTVAVIDSQDDQLLDTLAVGGAPGRMALGPNGVLWVCDSLDGRLLAVDTVQGTVLRNVDQALMLAPADPDSGVFSYLADVAVASDGTIYALAFNFDELVVVPPAAQADSD